MITTIKIEKELNFTHLKVKCGPRYWEATTVNGEDDKDGKLIPLREGDDWCPVIEIDNGIINNWPKGVTASVHYKVCDDGDYWLVADDGFELKSADSYVPSILDIYKDSYGDYVILNIDENGQIADWPKTHNVDDFLTEVDN